MRVSPIIGRLFKNSRSGSQVQLGLVARKKGRPQAFCALCMEWKKNIEQACWKTLLLHVMTLWFNFRELYDRSRYYRL